jgi:microcystin-dependent protein
MDEYIGMIKLFAGNFAPKNFLFCEGQTMSIAQYSALFAILGTTYGGDGKTNFKLPDLRGRVSIGAGNGPGLTPRVPGETGGTENVTLTVDQIPPHNHTYNALSGNREAPSPEGNFLGTAAGNFYSQQDPGDLLLPMNAGAISNSGGGQAHNNMQPFLSLNYIICVFGIYPSRG